MRVPMIVTKAFRPGGSNSPQLQPGDAFEATTEGMARLVRAMGWCKDGSPEPEPEPPKVNRYQRRAIVAEAPESAEPEAAADETPAPAKKRAYKRRDLTAE